MRRKHLKCALETERKAADDIRLTSNLSTERVELVQKRIKTFAKRLKNQLKQVSQQLWGLNSLIVGTQKNGTRKNPGVSSSRKLNSRQSLRLPTRSEIQISIKKRIKGEFDLEIEIDPTISKGKIRKTRSRIIESSLWRQSKQQTIATQKEIESKKVEIGIKLSDYDNEYAFLLFSRVLCSVVELGMKNYQSHSFPPHIQTLL